MREKVLANKPKKKRKKKSAQLRRDLKELKGISKYFRPQPTQTVRDKYKAMPGFAPTVVTFSRVAPDRQDGPRFDVLYQEQPEAAASMAESKVLEAGDIVGVLAAEENGDLSNDGWWLWRVSRDLFEVRPRTQVHGSYLEYETTDDAGNRMFIRTPETHKPLKIYNLLKDETGTPFIIVKEHYRENRDGVMINPEACHKLDELVSLATEEEESEDDASSESSSDEEEVVSLPQKRSRKIVRGGITFDTYEDFQKGD